MASFECAVAVVLEHEGGYVNDPRDPGGETNFGISKRRYPNLDIKNLTVEKAKSIYRTDYWVPYYSRINDQLLANALFDFGVNAGTIRAVRELQLAVNECASKKIDVDGVFGKQTLAAVNACNPKELLKRFTVFRILYYTSLDRDEFLKGWISRSLNCMEAA